MPDTVKAFIPDMFDTTDRIRSINKNLTATIKRLNISIGNRKDGKEVQLEKPDKEELGEIEELQLALNKLEKDAAENLHDLDEYMNKTLGPLQAKATRQ